MISEHRAGIPGVRMGHLWRSALQPGCIWKPRSSFEFSSGISRSRNEGLVSERSRAPIPGLTADRPVADGSFTVFAPFECLGAADVIRSRVSVATLEVCCMCTRPVLEAQRLFLMVGLQRYAP